MSDDRNKYLRKMVRRLTKRIGEALKAHDHNEASNLRQQRETFTVSLIEEFEEYFIIRDGKSCFVDLEEAQEHYSDDDNKKSVAVAGAVSELYQSREYLRKRYNELDGMTPDKVKLKILNEAAEQMTRLEEMMNGLLKDIGKDAINFEEADAAKSEGNDFLDGIDMSSLL